MGRLRDPILLEAARGHALTFVDTARRAQALDLELSVKMRGATGAVSTEES